MPLQNRVTPFGEIVAIPQRGTLTGNRGIIHDPASKTLLPRRWATKAWLVCILEYKDHRRDVMSRRSWTELFFLDEPTALAAGHRPCFFCRREAAKTFRACMESATGRALSTAAAVDSVLHAERIDQGHKRLHPIPAPLPSLPDGTVVSACGQAFTLRDGLAHRWTDVGYAPPERLDAADFLVTPPSTMGALRAGYRPAFHPSIDTAPHRIPNV